jgi:hypothetical protein
MSDEDGRPELKPARPDAPESEGRPSYAPRLPWKWIILGVFGVAAVFASYFIRQGQRQEALRQQMLTLHHDRLTSVAERYLGFRRRLETWVIEAGAAGEPERYVDPRLNISGLRSGEGLYLRVPADFAGSPEQIEGAAMAMEQDGITRCLGIAPMSVRGLYEKGYFLTPEWVDSVRDEPDMMRLRVLDDQLGRHIQVDAPVVLSMMQADWFMLVIERGENRRDHPVDVYLWDLRRNQQLLRARIQGNGLLVPVRLRFEGVTPAPAPGRPQLRSGGAADCSIASQIRALAGGEAIDFESGAQLIDAAAREGAEAEGAEAEGAEGQDAEGEDAEGEGDGEGATEGEPGETSEEGTPDEAEPPAQPAPAGQPAPTPLGARSM